MPAKSSRAAVPRASSPAPTAAPPSAASTATRASALAGALLVALVTGVAYLPCLRGGFILDDNLLLVQNSLIHAPDGLYRFWFTSEPIDYWPVFNTTFWIEWRLWGMNPLGYHVTNLILHVATALLLWGALRRLAVPGAFLGALLFAVHPVNVESVAWITQRKNLLALLFCLLAAIAYLEFDARSSRSSPRSAGEAGSGYYAASLAAFVLAMLSKGSVAILPVLLLGFLWWRRPLSVRDVVRMAPFFAVSLGLVLVNMWFQGRFVQAAARATGLVERLLGAGAAPWFYLGKALWPLDLAFVYPKWHVDPGRLAWWLPLSASLAATGVLWWYRAGWSRPWLFAWGFFCVALVPVMGLTDVGFMEHSLVADHYQHLALIGVTALVAAGWDVARRRLPEGAGWAANAAAAAVVAALALLTWRQSALYTDALTLYRATLERNPGSAFVHNLYGQTLFPLGRVEEAIEHYEETLRLKPDFPEAHYNLGVALMRSGRVEEALPHLRQALEGRPYFPEYHFELGTALARTHQSQAAIEAFEAALRLRPDYADALNNLGGVLLESGRSREAVEKYEGAVRANPDFAEARGNLGHALVQAGRSEEAIAHLQEALRLELRSPKIHNTLGVALTNAGRLQDAIAQFREALRIEPSDRVTKANLDEVEALAKKARANP